MAFAENSVELSVAFIHVSKSLPHSVCPLLSQQSIIRVVFHDRRLQYTEHQQLEGWRWSRPGDRILDIGENLPVHV